MKPNSKKSHASSMKNCVYCHCHLFLFLYFMCWFIVIIILLSGTLSIVVLKKWDEFKSECIFTKTTLIIIIAKFWWLVSGPMLEIPEDLYHLIKNAVSIRNHLERNKKEKDSKFRLILVDSRIHRLARYYNKTKELPQVWK